LYRAVVIDFGDSLVLHYQKHVVVRETAAFYVVMINRKERRVGKHSRSQFAATTKEKALMDAFHRNIRHRTILKSRMTFADRAANFLIEQINL
jgi:hypothetical protein